MKRLMGLGLALLASLGLAQESEELMSYAPRAQVPPGYPSTYAATVRAAEDEGRLVIYATTDTAIARPLIADFKAMYPRINVEYEDLTSTELHYRFVAETQLGGGSADVIWSSAMDLQSSLVSNGYAQTYESPESAGLPAWAKWKGQAWATTFEPIAIAYNKTLIPASEVPRTHADLARLLNGSAERFKGKVITYDIEKSGLGFFLATQDVGVAPVFWDIAQGFGKVDVRFASTTDAMLKQVASGKATIAYNVLGSYAVAQARKDCEHRVRISLGLHARHVALAAHQQESDASERRSTVGGLHPLEARSDRDRQSGRPLLGARRCQRRTRLPRA